MQRKKMCYNVYKTIIKIMSSIKLEYKIIIIICILITKSVT